MSNSKHALSKRGALHEALSVTLKDAEKAINRYKTQGWDVDPLDASQQRAYLQLRATAGRVDAKSFAAFLKSMTTDIRTGASSEMIFGQFPKSILRRDCRMIWHKLLCLRLK